MIRSPNLWHIYTKNRAYSTKLSVATLKVNGNGEWNGKKKKKWIKHYSSSHKILLVGEGDFSFPACLARAFGSAANMVATSLDCKEELDQKYLKAATHLKELKGRGCIIIHQVDEHTMSQHPLLHHNFDRVIFKFPHAGLPLQNENNRLQIKFHQEVVKGFLNSAREMVSNGGEIHVTHKTAHPFSRWEIEKLAEEVGLSLVETTKFTRCDYPGYINKRGYGRKCNKAFRFGECCTFKFVKMGFVYS